MKPSSNLVANLTQHARKIVMALALAAIVGGLAAAPASARERDDYGSRHQVYSQHFRHDARDVRDAHRFHDGRGMRDFRHDESRAHRGW
jgi:Ni/Co efflux regulator RcnB